MRRLLAVVGFALVLALGSSPVLATTTTTSGEGETTATTVTIEPAVPVTEAPPAEEQPDWTYRYFIPALLVLAGLVVVMTVVQYFVTVVRKRYRVVR